jgi:two-component system sensor histidine kinase MtrB
MEISRLDAGAAPMAREPVDVGRLVGSAVAVRGWSGQVEIDLRHGPDQPVVPADPRRLDTVVSNLVGNALEHGEPPVRVAVSADADAVTVVVSDAGPGIAPADLGRVFDRFFKADPARPGGRGSGLGLAIARENARLHGGDLTVASPPGSGATFTLTLPRSVAEPLPTGDGAVITARHDPVP